MSSSSPSDVRPAVLAGSWYPADREVLYKQMEHWIGEAGDAPAGFRAKIVIVPHAGYRYSGQTAAHAYRALREGNWGRIIVLGPSHRTILPRPCVLSPFGAVDTPLGQLEIARLKDVLGECNDYTMGRRGVDEQEHSLEMQYPFIKCILPDAEIVPIMVGEEQVSPTAARLLAAELARDDTAMVVSSDFCHWGKSFGYCPRLGAYEGETVGARIDALNREALCAIEGGDPAVFGSYLERTGNTICGRNPILLCMQIINHLDAKGSWHWLHFASSAQTEQVNTEQSSVSYIAGAYFVHA